MIDENTYGKLNGLAVVLVDDDTYLLRAYKKRMKDSPYRLFLFSDPLSALEEVAKTENVAVVVSDYQMPNMFGDKLLRKVEELHPSAVRILSSANPRFLDEQRGTGVAQIYVDKTEMLLKAREIIDKAALEYLK
jgi:response regulator RpfG family c-di-GMP phosphodiesterase